MKKLSRFRVYRKLSVMYLAIVSFTIAILSCILFLVFRHTFIDDTNLNTVTVLSEKNDAFSNLIMQTNSAAVQILNNSTVKDYLASGQNRPIDKYYVSRVLNEIYPIYPFISFVELCNAKMGSYFNTSILPQATIDEIKRDSLEYILNINNGGINYDVRTYSNELIPKNPVETTVFSIFIPSYKKNDHYVIINIPQNYIFDTLDLENTAETQVFMINESRKALMPAGSQDPVTLQTDVSLDKIMDGQEQGFIQNINNSPYITNYKKTDFFDYYLVKLVSSNQALRNSTRVLYITIIVASVAMMAAFLLMLTLSRIIYAPVIGIIENIKESQEGADYIDEFELINEELLKQKNEIENNASMNTRNQKVINMHILTSLLMGRSIYQINELLSFSQELQYLLEKNRYYFVCLFTIDPSEADPPNSTVTDIDLVDYGLSNIIVEILSLLFDTKTVTVSSHKICAIVSGTDKRSVRRINELLSEAIQQIWKYINQKATVICSEEVDSTEMIAKAYEECQALSKEIFFCEKGTIITSEYAATRKKGNPKYTYNYSGDINLIYDLSAYNQLLESISKFIDALSVQPYEIAKLEISKYVADLKESLLKHRELLSLTQQDIEHLCYGVLNAPYLSTVSEQLREIFSAINTTLKNSSNIGIAQKHYELVEMIKSFVKNNYQDPNLSLNMIADSVCISAGYLGKIFKNITDVSFTKYLCNIRLEQAKKLLITTNQSSYKIAEEIGIISATYFTTLFKKQYGKTPAQYREQYNRMIYDGSSAQEPG